MWGGLYFGFGVPPAAPRQVMALPTRPFQPHANIAYAATRYSGRTYPGTGEPAEAGVSEGLLSTYGRGHLAHVLHLAPL